MRYQLYREQQLHCDIDTAWQFFSSPHKLAEITPKNMAFTVMTDLKNRSIYEGMFIEYKVSPLFNIAMKWQTAITQVDVNRSFTDFQIKGPYKYWNHHHEFIPNDDGVLIKDTVDYELPFGIIGVLAHALLVKRKLNTIFDYRYCVLHEMFGQ